MKIWYEHWQIAFREKTEKKFRLIPNPSWGWAADPFLVRYKGELYLLLNYICINQNVME